ncbi:hypothetical protein HFN88_05195 [Rhizobium laguerreae]|uniref:hypothetical protein n=1 Tax=Rhizobium laguerreae TaxID=1076926 RepID=UPI001C90C399|nr:hypothetical protein [Rhizobium laguerreae]MBY3392081.1 hypothetical protein [Rhizobium laguerreae]
MEEDWWPDMMRDTASEDPWGEELVTVAEMAGYDDPMHPGQRILWSALVSPEDLASLGGNLRAFNHEVESTGRPGPRAAGALNPRFHISAFLDDRRIECEPLVLGWVNANRTAMMLDPRFAMTYGLMPRALGDGTVRWDDPAAPEFDVAIVDPPSVYENLKVSRARTRVSRSHLQDYLTLRGMHLVQVFYEYRSAVRDTAIQAALGGQDRRVERLLTREFDISTNRDGSYTAQVWGARVIAGPGTMPITADDLDNAGLAWPGIAESVTHGVARKFRLHDWIYVRDTVLAAYEGRSGFQVYPESGGVAFGGQWSVGHCERVGRDVIRAELKKLYEGTPDRVIRHWHAHAIVPGSHVQGEGAANMRNISVRASELVHAVVAIGEHLSALASALKLTERPGADLVGLDREFLNYNGWWSGPFVEPVTRHVPMDMSREAFLDRCLDLDKLAIESLAERHLRPMVRAIGAPEDSIDSFRGLKLLDRLACLAQVAVAGGLSLTTAGPEIVSRYHREGTKPAQPLTRLFALSDLRQIKGHRKQEIDARIEGALARFGIDTRAAAGGWGVTLDTVYDGAIEELTSVDATFAKALALIAED